MHVPRDATVWRYHRPVAGGGARLGPYHLDRDGIHTSCSGRRRPVSLQLISVLVSCLRAGPKPPLIRVLLKTLAPSRRGPERCVRPARQPPLIPRKAKPIQVRRRDGPALIVRVVAVPRRPVARLKPIQAARRKLLRGPLKAKTKGPTSRPRARRPGPFTPPRR